VELGYQLKQKNVLPQLLMSLGVTLGVQGDYEQANRYMQESVDLAREQRSQWHLAAALTYWGVLNLKFQKVEAAVTNFQEVITLDKSSSQDPQFVAESYYGLATVAAARGNLEEAHRYGEQSLAIFESIKHYMTPEVKKWLEGLAEKDQSYGADRANAMLHKKSEQQ
jgi:tetratricopeptide (TPR) repeat protein